jgi:hypothetical protein
MYKDTEETESFAIVFAPSIFKKGIDLFDLLHLYSNPLPDINGSHS